VLQAPALIYASNFLEDQLVSTAPL